jgi:hypothetical protein
MRAWTRFEDWANVVLGAYLFFVPFFVAANAASAWNAYIVGILILCVALYALAQPDSKGAEWTNVVLGAWMIIAPFVLGSASLAGAMATNAYVVGVLAIVFAGIALYRMGHSGTAAHHGTR